MCTETWSEVDSFRKVSMLEGKLAHWGGCLKELTCQWHWCSSHRLHCAQLTAQLVMEIFLTIIRIRDCGISQFQVSLEVCLCITVWELWH